ncbi:MAG: YhcH/YjgK/YiaL family protein [Opitutae bacterium]|nr:YhcH/YjgK/YiaL family protein [Opitutae bacterium]
MAQFGPYATLVTQLPYSAQFAAAFGYVAEMLRPGSAARARIDALAPGHSGKIELAAGAFAIEQAYFTKPRAEGFFESHRKSIDVQVVVAGEESMEVEDISRLAVTHAYDVERDLIKYADTAAASRLALRAGDLALFFPADAHMPSLQLGGPVLVRKTVVKVPVA